MMRNIIAGTLAGAMALAVGCKGEESLSTKLSFEEVPTIVVVNDRDELEIALRTYGHAEKFAEQYGSPIFGSLMVGDLDSDGMDDLSIDRYYGYEWCIDKYVILSGDSGKAIETDRNGKPVLEYPLSFELRTEYCGM